MFNDERPRLKAILEGTKTEDGRARITAWVNNEWKSFIEVKE